MSEAAAVPAHDLTVEVVPDAPSTFHSLTDLMLAGASQNNPWAAPDDFEADEDLLCSLLSISLRQGKPQASGLFARAVDAWVAHELRRGGFGPDEVWPRATQPRWLPQPLAALERELRPGDRAALRRLVKGGADARILGAYYDKQVDVVVSDWDRGAELLVSTRSMLSSYRNNLHNRSEDLVGDADNLRGRYPLASIGLLFVVRANIFDEPDALAFLRDMLLRLRQPGRMYEATGLIVAEWDDNSFGSWLRSDVEPDEDDGPVTLGTLLASPSMVALRQHDAPHDLGLSRFFLDLVGTVLSRTPVNYHAEVRQLRGSTDVNPPRG